VAKPSSPKAPIAVVEKERERLGAPLGGKGVARTTTQPQMRCVSSGDTLEDVEPNVREAVELYLDTLKDKSLPIPESRHETRRVAVAV
jgi:hypothetical protein